MRFIKGWMVLTTIALLLWSPACGGAVESAKGSGDITLVILPFENNSVTDTQRFEPLSKGLSAMLITDLSNSKTRLKVVEREKIQAILKEIALGQSGAVDESTAIEAGRILGARAIAIGSFMVIEKKVRIDTRIIDIETSKVMMADSIMGGSDDFINLEQELAQKIAESFEVDLDTKNITSKGSISAALYFSKGLEALDRGDHAEADRQFRKSIKMDPAYKEQVEKARGPK
jgi:TolB-like protein